jgi:transposase
MIPHGVEIFVGLEPIDLRWGFDRLCGTAQERVGRNGRCGALFVFFGRRRTALKIFFADATGVCIFYKRLDKGTFRLPEPTHDNDTSVLVDERVLDDLLDGIDLEPTRPRRRTRAQLH